MAELKKEYFESGELKSECFEVNGKKYGEHKIYNKNGQLLNSCSYVDGKKNGDLWNEFLKIYAQHQVKMHWVKGHAGHPGNERCDQLATAAADDRANLMIDHVYEQEQKAEKGLL